MFDDVTDVEFLLASENTYLRVMFQRFQYGLLIFRICNKSLKQICAVHDKCEGG